MKRHLLIVLRTCTIVNMVNDSGNGRYIKVPKSQLALTCISSLVNSINHVQGHEVELIVLDDHSDSESVENFKNILANCKFPTSFKSVVDGTGNSHTLKKVYDEVQANCKDLWYHVEDDYLHVPEAIHDMIDTVDSFEPLTGKLVAVNPHDDVWRYKFEIYQGFLLHGPYRHYRTVKHTTGTCLASRKIFDQYKSHFYDLATMIGNKTDWAENKSINLVWNKDNVVLVSPIPGLGFHIMDESGKDPYFDIDNLWNSVPKLWRKTQKPKMAIVSFFNDKHKDLAQHTWYDNKVKYANKHGYLALAKTDNFSAEQVHFDKFTHILDVMKNHSDIDWIWWLDNDAMITNFDIKVEDLVDDNYHIVMPVDIAAINTGSFIVRNSAEAKDWLEFILSKKKEYKNDTRWYEQQAVVDLYPKHQHLFKLVPQQWMNSYDYRIYNVDSKDLLNQDGQWCPGDFVIHWPGLQNNVRIQLAQQYKKLIQETL